MSADLVGNPGSRRLRLAAVVTIAMRHPSTAILMVSASFQGDEQGAEERWAAGPGALGGERLADTGLEQRDSRGGEAGHADAVLACRVGRTRVPTRW